MQSMNFVSRSLLNVPFCLLLNPSIATAAAADCLATLAQDQQNCLVAAQQMEANINATSNAALLALDAWGNAAIAACTGVPQCETNIRNMHEIALLAITAENVAQHLLNTALYSACQVAVYVKYLLCLPPEGG